MERTRVAAAPRAAASDLAPGELRHFFRLYERSLKAVNRAEPTVYKYLLSARQLVEVLEQASMPTAAPAVHREHVEAFIAHSLETTRASTSATRYQALRVFFNFLVEEGEGDMAALPRTVGAEVERGVSHHDPRPDRSGCLQLSNRR